ncbi:MAG: radical SAM protein [Candidatus Omnitrophota bacterium]
MNIMGSSRVVKYIRFAASLLYARLFNQRIPLFVTLCVTNRCNLRCVYCYADCGSQERKEFTTREICDIVDHLCSLGMRYISLNGGEALLREDIDQVVDHINQKGILCQITTNGLLVEKKIEVLRKVDAITMSLDGGRIENDRNRGAGVYDHVMKAMKVLRANKMRFQTSMVLTKNNVDSVKEALQLAQQLDFQVLFSPLRVEDSPDKELGLDDARLKETVRQIIGYKDAGFPVFFSRDVYQQFLDWPFSYNRLNVFKATDGFFEGDVCYLKQLSCHIESDGSVYPCIVLAKKVKVSSFLDVGIKQCFDQQQKLSCQACWNFCCNDWNHVLSLRPRAWWNVLGIIKRRFTN